MQSNEDARRRPCLSPFTAMVIPLVLSAVVLGWGLPVGSLADTLEYEPDVVIVMKEKAFHVIKGAEPDKTPPYPTFSLAPGMDVILLLRNEDDVAHEFVSPLLLKVDIRLSGRAAMVYTHTAAGVRVNPQDSVTLRFEVPEAGYDQFHFWCNIHGKLLDSKMRGEIFILERSTQ